MRSRGSQQQAAGVFPSRGGQQQAAGVFPSRGGQQQAAGVFPSRGGQQQAAGVFPSHGTCHYVIGGRRTEAALLWHTPARANAGNSKDKVICWCISLFVHILPYKSCYNSATTSNGLMVGYISGRGGSRKGRRVIFQ